MHVRFWGTRGSLPKPGQTTLRYGGNTSCVEVRAADGTLVVLDCGTGAHGLGCALVAASPSPIRGYLLIGHTHWDHIQGFPFFTPLFVPGNVWAIYAPGGHGGQIEASLAGQMAYEYFPITFEALQAEVQLHDLTEGVFELGSVRVTTQYLNHPALTLGYRLEADGATLVYATDYEPHALHPLGAPPGTAPVHHEDRRHIRFLEGADLVIHDAQYTLDDFPTKAGWGHTPMECAVDYAMLARVKQLALFHHDPDRHDEAIDRLCELARARAGAGAGMLQVFAAAEGQVIELAQGPARPRSAIAPEASALLALAPRGTSTVLIVDDDPAMVLMLEATLRTEGVRVLTATDGESALTLARQKRPALILLDMHLPGLDGLALCRILRAELDPRLCDVPIVMLTGVKLTETDLVEAFMAGATDYLTKPVKSTLIRSRVRAWLLRTSPA
jgi:CheY-like chemotaxis protein/phosphoribosyl 1,2-cyclic phosphodiesterase